MYMPFWCSRINIVISEGNDFKWEKETEFSILRKTEFSKNKIKNIIYIHNREQVVKACVHDHQKNDTLIK